ncbi:hypothetical protein XENTR_v10015206 [Xenopus tropicalis]|nr:hypothetical protein XENTR_v10015206 [Xenopus tropicalis]
MASRLCDRFLDCVLDCVRGLCTRLGYSKKTEKEKYPKWERVYIFEDESSVFIPTYYVDLK